MEVALEVVNGLRLKELKCLLEKANIIVNRPLRAILMRAQKERRTVENNCFRKYLNSPEQNISRNMDGNNHLVEVLDRNEHHVIGNWRKGHSYYK